MVARYDDLSYTANTTPDEVFRDVSDLGLRWNILKGGLQRFEFTIRAASEFEAYERYRTHLGHLVGIHDTYLNRVITGNIYEIRPEGRLVTYIGAGPARRLNDDNYSSADMTDLTLPTDDTDVVLKDILDDTVPISSADQSNIDATSVDIGAWVPDTWYFRPVYSGTFKKTDECIADLALMGNSSSVGMDFYFVDAPLNGVSIQKPLPYFKARSKTADPDWRFSAKTLPRDGLMLARHIWDIASNVNVGYGRLTGTHNGATSAHLIDTTASFEASGVVLGDKVTNVTDGWTRAVEAFVDPVNDDELDLHDSPDGTEWASGERYSIKLQETNWNTELSEVNYWSRSARIKQQALDNTQADLYRALYHALYKDALLQQAFVIGDPFIEDGQGKNWPLWTPLFMPTGTAYFEVTDLFPEAALTGASEDRQQAFMAVSMDYTQKDNRFRVVPSTGDSRLDVMLERAIAEKQQIGEIISTRA
jgi:hypothetical protein